MEVDISGLQVEMVTGNAQELASMLDGENSLSIETAQKALELIQLIEAEASDLADELEEKIEEAENADD